MSLLSLFSPINLLIWVPGLLFLVFSLKLLSSSNSSSSGKNLFYGTIGFFVISVIIAFTVPNMEMNKAIAFANSYEGSDGVEVTSFQEIPFNVKFAYVQTALPEEEREEMVVSSDIFSFGAVEETIVEEVEATVNDESDGDDIVYNKGREFSWFLLISFLLPGVILLLKDFGKLLLNVRKVPA